MAADSFGTSMTRRNDLGQALHGDRARVLQHAHVSREIENRLDRFVDLLLRWQKTTNLIGDTTVHNLWTRHVADSLQLLAPAPQARVWVDLGSGAGFPGLVIACALADMPDAVVHLVESNGKKAAFLREAARLSAVPARVHPIRIEQFAATFEGPVDVVTARALAPLRDLLQLAEPLLKRGAKGLFLKGQDVEVELTTASKCWTMDYSLVPSRTSAHGCVVVVNRAQPSDRV